MSGFLIQSIGYDNQSGEFAKIIQDIEQTNQKEEKHTTTPVKEEKEEKEDSTTDVKYENNRDLSVSINMDPSSINLETEHLVKIPFSSHDDKESNIQATKRNQKNDEEKKDPSPRNYKKKILIYILIMLIPWIVAALSLSSSLSPSDRIKKSFLIGFTCDIMICSFIAFCKLIVFEKETNPNFQWFHSICKYWHVFYFPFCFLFNSFLPFFFSNVISSDNITFVIIMLAFQTLLAICYVPVYLFNRNSSFFSS